MSARRAAVVAGALWLVGVLICAVLPPEAGAQLNREGGAVEGASAFFAGLGASVALLALARHQRAARPGRADVVDLAVAVIIVAAGVVCAGEELSWGEGSLWHELTLDRGARLDAGHDVFNLLEAGLVRGGASAVVAKGIVVGVVGGGVVAVVAVLARVSRRPSTGPLASLAVAAAFIGFGAVVDMVHVLSVLALAIEEVAELIGCMLILFSAGQAYRRSAAVHGEADGTR